MLSNVRDPEANAKANYSNQLFSYASTRFLLHRPLTVISTVDALTAEVYGEVLQSDRLSMCVFEPFSTDLKCALLQ